ncbi:MAG: YidC/Oxa1 family membrane protein insertase [Myxococcales bacterium]|nr:YidC/Oxa1 family membrane protein insertase [Myxococcales bacterium]
MQTPLFLGLFHAIRGVLSTSGAGQSFMWIKNLAGPDLGLALMVAGLVALGSITGSVPAQQPNWMLVLPALLTLVMLLKLSAGFGLYMGASAMVTTLQALIVRRLEARQPVAATRR